MFYDKFLPGEYTLFENNNWLIVLRQKQITLGSAVIILKREVSSIADATSKEMEDFPHAIRWYENKCISLFAAEKFNYVAAMMKDNFVHFHAFPRYSNNKDFIGQIWNDEFWPKPISLIDVKTEKLVLDKLFKFMKQ